MFPEIAIRELVAHALIHQDFTESGTSVMVEIYDDRMEISNLGLPFISPDRFIDEYQSRNERLADIMRRLGICEEKGSGIDKVIHAAEGFQLPAPDFRVGQRRTSALLFAHQEIEKMDRGDRIQLRNGLAASSTRAFGGRRIPLAGRFSRPLFSRQQGFCWHVPDERVQRWCCLNQADADGRLLISSIMDNPSGIPTMAVMPSPRRITGCPLKMPACNRLPVQES